MITILRFKYLIFFIATALYVSNARAGENQLAQSSSVIIEAGYAFTGSGDIGGTCVAAEYGKYLSSRIKVSGIIESMSFLQNYNSLLTCSNLKGVGIHGYCDFLNLNNLRFQIGAGAIYRNWTWVYATADNLTYLNSNGFLLPPSSFGSFRNNTIGYSVSLGSIIFVSKTLGVSFRGLFQNDTNGDSTVSARVGLNFNF